jgi:co-chaperonin GroES (HSP10)
MVSKQVDNSELEWEGEKYLIMRQSDILAII